MRKYRFHFIADLPAGPRWEFFYIFFPSTWDPNREGPLWKFAHDPSKKIYPHGCFSQNVFFDAFQWDTSLWNINGKVLEIVPIWHLFFARWNFCPRWKTVLCGQKIFLYDPAKTNVEQKLIIVMFQINDPPHYIYCKKMVTGRKMLNFSCLTGTIFFF